LWTGTVLNAVAAACLEAIVERRVEKLGTLAELKVTALRRWKGRAKDKRR
jgi:hypothetical protein